MLKNVALIAVIVIGFFLSNFFSQKGREEEVSSTLSYILHETETEQDYDFDLAFNKPLLVNFSASWCSSCKEETPFLKNLEKNYHGSKVFMISVKTMDKGGTKNSPFQFPVVFDSKATLIKKYAVEEALPQTILFNKDGVIVHHVTGALDARETKIIETKISQLEEGKVPRPGDLKNQMVMMDMKRGMKSPLAELPSFSLVRSSGESFHSQDLEDKIWIANFIFTTCPSMCPMLTKKMKRLEDEFQSEKSVRLVSVSVDPATDTPQMLKDYEIKNQVNTSFWYFLTGDWEKQVRPLMSSGFKLRIPLDPAFHTEKFVLVDKRFRVRGYYSSHSKRAMKQLKEDLSKLIKKHNRIKGTSV